MTFVEFLSKMVDGYETAIRWTGYDEDGTAYDNEKYEDVEWSEVGMAGIEATCKDFLLSTDVRVFTLDPEQVGHDFLLTRDDHGTGFWDRTYTAANRDLGRILTDACKPYGDSGLFEDDGLWHVSFADEERGQIQEARARILTPNDATPHEYEHAFLAWLVRNWSNAATFTARDLVNLHDQWTNER